MSIVRVAVLGGAFDPVHYGHLRSAVEVHEQLQTDCFFLMPCGEPALKSELGASAGQRLQMLELALQEFSALAIDDREIQRAGTSYTFDSLVGIRRSLADDDQLFFVMGSDAFRQFHHWHCWQDIPGQASLVVMQREGERLELSALDRELADWLSDYEVVVSPLESEGPRQVLMLETRPYAIASTAIRQALLNRGDAACRARVKEWVPASVLEYIETEKLYPERQVSVQ